jgi:hypothetical protein
MYEALNRSGGILTVDLEQVGRKDAFLDCGGLFGEPKSPRFRLWCSLPAELRKHRHGNTLFHGPPLY